MNDIHIILVIPKKLPLPLDPVIPEIKSATAVDAAYVCAPYQNIATKPLAMAGKFAPKTPILDLTNTGKGIPCLTLGFPERFTNHIIKKPARINARNTAQPFNPDANNHDAAKV